MCPWRPAKRLRRADPRCARRRSSRLAWSCWRAAARSADNSSRTSGAGRLSLTIQPVVRLSTLRRNNSVFSPSLDVLPDIMVSHSFNGRRERRTAPHWSRQRAGPAGHCRWNSQLDGNGADDAALAIRYGARTDCSPVSSWLVSTASILRRIFTLPLILAMPSRYDVATSTPKSGVSSISAPVRFRTSEHRPRRFPSASRRRLRPLARR